jgi:hypothetical protein
MEIATVDAVPEIPAALVVLLLGATQLPDSGEGMIAASICFFD